MREQLGTFFRIGGLITKAIGTRALNKLLDVTDSKIAEIRAKRAVQPEDVGAVVLQLVHDADRSPDPAQLPAPSEQNKTPVSTS